MVSTACRDTLTLRSCRTECREADSLAPMDLGNASSWTTADRKCPAYLALLFRLSFRVLQQGRAYACISFTDNSFLPL